MLLSYRRKLLFLSVFYFIDHDLAALTYEVRCGGNAASTETVERSITKKLYTYHSSLGLAYGCNLWTPIFIPMVFISKIIMPGLTVPEPGTHNKKSAAE